MSWIGGRVGRLSAELLSSLNKKFQGYPVQSLFWLLELEPEGAAQALAALQSEQRAWMSASQATPPLEVLLLRSLADLEPPTRARAASCASKLAQDKASIALQPPMLIGLAPLLADATASVALAAAHRLWICARGGADVSCIQPELQGALSSSHENVPFFASLALSHLAYRTKNTPPPITPHSSPPEIGEIFYPRSDIRHYCSHQGESNSVLHPSSDICILCGNPEAQQVYYEVDGSNAGGTYYYVYRCDRCGKYTHHEQDFG